MNDLVEELALEPHPEGGFYRRIHTSVLDVVQDGRSRPAVSQIYYLLREGQCSRWHVMRSDECWHHLRGDSLDLVAFNPANGEIELVEVGPGAPVAVPAGWWQAVRVVQNEVLVTCTVAPAFDFNDHRFVRDLPEHEAVFEGILAPFRALL